MKNIEEKPTRKKRYSKISTQKRHKLAKMVLEEGQTLTKVAKLLRIKRPTAKVILKRYKECGTFFQKKTPQFRTKTSLASNQQLKHEQLSNNDVSVELPNSQPEGLLKQEPAEPLAGVANEPNEGTGYVVYYPVFDPYRGFMNQHCSASTTLSLHSASQNSNPRLQIYWHQQSRHPLFRPCYQTFYSHSPRMLHQAASPTILYSPPSQMTQYLLSFLSIQSISEVCSTPSSKLLPSPNKKLEIQDFTQFQKEAPILNAVLALD